MANKKGNVSIKKRRIDSEEDDSGDITPINQQTFDDLRQQIETSSSYFGGLTSLTPHIMQPTAEEGKQKKRVRTKIAQGQAQLLAKKTHGRNEAKSPTPEANDSDVDEMEETKESKKRKDVSEPAPSNGLLGTLILSTKTGAPEAEELKNKLKTRIESLKLRRHAGEAGTKDRSNNSSKVKKPPKSMRKMTLHQPIEEPADSAPVVPVVRDAPPKSANVPENLDFGVFDFRSDKPVPYYLLKEGKAKTSKSKQLERLQAENEKIEELKGTAEGESLEKKRDLGNALKKLKGEKVKDDAKKLKQSIRNDRVKKKKAAISWQNKQEAMKKEVQHKQAVRQKNIDEHKQMKKQKRQALTDKRLLKRAGFEGKKR